MTSSTRIYNRFRYWSVADCDCEFCQWKGTKKRLCLLETCCCEDIRQEALRREQAAASGEYARSTSEALPCRG